MAASEEEQLRLDHEELKQLEAAAKRPRVRALLASEIRNVDAKLSKIAVPAEKMPTVPTEKTVTVPPVSYTTLGSFSWDQDDERIKIYIFLEGVDQEKVETVFKPMSLDVKFHDIKGKNYQCVIPKLNREINPEKCKVIVKPTRVVITLQKAFKGNWSDLHFKEDKFKPNAEKEKDPMAGIMDLMKNMYDEGDDDMKRTIAKAWSDARSGKASDSLRGLP